MHLKSNSELDSAIYPYLSLSICTDGYEQVRIGMFRNGVDAGSVLSSRFRGQIPALYYLIANPCNHVLNNICCASFMLPKLTPNPIDGSDRATVPTPVNVAPSYLSVSSISVPGGSE